MNRCLAKVKMQRILEIFWVIIFFLHVQWIKQSKISTRKCLTSFSSDPSYWRSKKEKCLISIARCHWIFCRLMIFAAERTLLSWISNNLARSLFISLNLSDLQIILIHIWYGFQVQTIHYEVELLGKLHVEKPQYAKETSLIKFSIPFCSSLSQFIHNKPQENILTIHLLWFW